MLLWRLVNIVRINLVHAGFPVRGLRYRPIFNNNGGGRKLIYRTGSLS